MRHFYDGYSRDLCPYYGLTNDVETTPAILL